MTNIKTQGALISYFKASLLDKKVRIKTSSRSLKHLRIEYRMDLQKLFSQIHNVTIDESDVVISAAYKTYTVKLNSPIKDVGKKGDMFYLVNAVSDKGTLTAKNLTPDELGLSGKEYTRTNLINSTMKALKASRVDTVAKSFCMDLLKMVGNRSYGKSKYMDMLSTSDKNIVGKNFGEILSSIWFLDQNRGYDIIEFPYASNEPLIDYCIKKSSTNEKLKVSAKYEKGAPPSIKAVVDILKSTKYTGKKKDAAEAIISIAESTTIIGIMKSAESLNTKGNKLLKKKIGWTKSGYVTPEAIEEYLSGFSTADDIIADMEDLYKVMGRSASTDIINRIVKNRQKRNGIIISPFGYNVVDILNKDPDYIELLNSVSRQLVITQVYLSFKTSGMQFVDKKFSDSDFQFAYNANAGQPSLKKISFKIK